MKSICSLMIVDLKMVLKNLFFWVLAGMLIVVILTVNVLLPQRTGTDSPDAVTEGFEAEWAGDAAAALLPTAREEGAIPVFISRTGNAVSPPPFHKRCLPVFICFEAVVQGFLLAGVLMLSEKSGKIVCALRVSPLRPFHYWLAKILLFSVIGSLYALFMAVFTVGLSFPVPLFIAASMTASAMFTMLGMMTAVFFRSLNNWFMLASLVLGINMLTMFVYLVPSLTLPFMRLIPSYPFLFIFEQILFGSWRLTSEAVLVVVWFSVLCAASMICVKNKFLRPQKEG